MLSSKKSILLYLVFLPVLCMVSLFAFAKPAPGLSFTVTGEGTPLILLHAFPTDHRLWTPQIDGLKNDFRVITPDLSGFGRSSTTDGEAITMQQQAQYIKQLMDQLQIKKAIIGGESMGGYIALAFLQQYPDRVEGIILSNTRATEDSPEAKAKREATAKEVLANGTASVINDFMAKALIPTTPEKVSATVKTMLEEQSAAGIASALRGMAARIDTSDVLRETKQPVLIITSDQDHLISPQESQNMHALAKNSRLVTIQNAGHLSNLEQSAQWNQAVIDMFK